MNSSAYSRLNFALGWGLIAMLALMPLPLGSNRPIFWMMWTGIIALMALVYLALGLLLEPQRPLRSARHKALFGLALLIPAMGLVQILPLFSVPPLTDALEAPRATLSVDPQRSLIGTLRILGYIAFFALCLEVASQRNRAEQLAWAAFFIVLAYGLYGLASLLVLGDVPYWGIKEQYRGSATGPFVNRNSFATYLGMGLCLGLGLTLRRAYRKRIRDPYGRHRGLIPDMEQLGLFACLGLLALTLLYTQSRLGLAACFLGVALCYLLYQTKHGSGVLRSLLWIAGVAILALVMVLFVYEANILNRLIFVEQSADTRFALYARILALIPENPVFGVGLDAFEPAFQQVQDASVTSGKRWGLAHSTYLANWFELGLIIGSVPIVLGGLVALRLVGLVRTRASQVVFPIVALSALVLVAVHSTMDFSLEMAANVYFLLFLLALGLAYRNEQNSPEASGS